MHTFPALRGVKRLNAPSSGHTVDIDSALGLTPLYAGLGVRTSGVTSVLPPHHPLTSPI